MKLNILYTGLCSVALLAVGCTEEAPSYEPAPACETPAVYFDPATTTSFKVGEADTELTVPVYRANAGEAASFPVTLSSATDAAAFNVPATVSFAAGEKLSSFDVTYVAKDLEGMKPYNLTFTVGDGKDTPYVYQNITYTIVYEPWNDVVGPNGEEYGIWKDDILTTFFDLPETALEWQVKIQSSPAVAGLYRIVNPYGTAAFPGIRFPTGSFASGGPLDGEDHYLYLNCADPSLVFICNASGSPLEGKDMVLFNTGADLSYGTIYITGEYNWEAADENIDPELAGSFTNGVVKFPAKSLDVAMANYQNGNFYYANTNGAFRILWPGAVEEEDPDEVWENIGTAAYTDVLITPLYNEDESIEDYSETWNVEVEQYKKDPNMYRLVNPYKEGVMPDGWNYDGDKYLVIDATNPNCLFVELQEVFYDDDPMIGGTIGAINYAYLLAANEWTPAQIIESGYNDVFANQIFTFGSENLCVVFPNTSVEQLKNKLLNFSTAQGKIDLTTTATQSVNRKAMCVKPAAKSATFVNPIRMIDINKHSNSKVLIGSKIAID